MKVAVTVIKDPEKDRRILCAATQVFSEQGFSAAETQAVADLAGVGKGTVYRYYGSKEELFLAVADAGMKQLERHVLATLEGEEETIRAIRGCGLAYAAFFQENPQLVEILIQERATFRGSIPDTHLVYRQKNRGVFEALLRRGVAEGTLRDLDVTEATNAFANLLYGTIVCGCLGGSTAELTRMASAAIEILLRGIVSDPSTLK